MVRVTRVVLALTRHGSYEQPPSVPSAHLPHPLTTVGEQQVHGLIESVLSFCRTASCTLEPVIETSSLLRAWQTASIAARRLTNDFGFESSVSEIDALAERSLGAAANLTVQAIADVVAKDPRYPDLPSHWKTQREYRLPFIGAESLREAGERVARHLIVLAHGIARDSKRDSVKLVVGHGASIRHAAVTLGVLDPARASQLSMHHCQPVFWEWVDNTCFRHIAGEWKERGQGAPLD